VEKVRWEEGRKRGGEEVDGINDELDDFHHEEQLTTSPV
jgi:hypothetical protein